MFIIRFIETCKRICRVGHAWHTVIKLFDIKCVRLNEEIYCEFFPCALMPKRPGRTRYSRR